MYYLPENCEIMKTNKLNKTKKLGIELFDSKLLKETKILDNDNYYDDPDEMEFETDDLDENIKEISLGEFNKTLE